MGFSRKLTDIIGPQGTERVVKSVWAARTEGECEPSCCFFNKLN